MAEEQILVGPPCSSCAQWSQSPRLPNIGMCDVYSTWQGAAERPWNCEKHMPMDSLEAKLKELTRALIWLRHAIDYFSGVNAGEPDDPMHFGLKGPTKRERKELDERLGRLTDGL